MANRNVYLILSVVLFASFISSTQSASCCLSYMRIPRSCHQLLGYTIQTINRSCDINAIIFRMQGKFVCADPSMRWTQKRMRCLDGRRKMAQIAGEKIRGSA